METAVFVMTHKECVLPNIPGYIRMQVGSALHDNLGYMRDDVGDDHISDLNPYYAELTGLYWLWKNYYEVNNIGLCHYRRYFINHNKSIMTMPEFEDILLNADIIIAEAEREKERVELPVYAVVEDVIKHIYPEDFQAFKNSCSRTKGTIGNLFVMKRAIMDDYCEWLFMILAEASGYLDLESYDDYHKKMLAIISEELLGVYIESRGLKAVACKAGIFGEKKETIELKQAIRFLMSQKKYAEGIELFDKVLKLRPDLILEASDLTGELIELRKEMQHLIEE